MCDFFWKRMESDRGDLADVVRSGGWAGGASTTSTDQIPVISDWDLPSDPSIFFPSDGIESINSFGDPFASLCDPFLDELTGIEFFNNNSSSSSKGGEGHGGGIVVIPQKLPVGEEEMKKPRTRTMPRLFQVASTGSGGINACPLSSPEAILVGEMMKASSGVCSADDGGVQISSPGTLGIKRRKNQVKRVVCIPAPASASSRPSGEVVPSDLWAWRKYGQKPIKGSPYPRGYYRCSSSKGCSARKQVERSRTNPNMLVVTYTSEHNHPWPTQRNALAGSTRSQSVKKTNTAAGSAPVRIKSNPSKEAHEDSLGQKEETSSDSIHNSWVREETIVAAAAGDDDGLAVGDVNNKGIHDDDDNDRYSDQQMMGCGKLQEADCNSCLFTDLEELEWESDPTSTLFFSKVQQLLGSKPLGDQNASDALTERV